MTTVFLQVVTTLRELVIPHAVIGAAALAVHGVSRSTLDLDLLTTDRTVLRSAVWEDLERTGAEVDVRIGDTSDPLAGVVRLSRPDARPVDVVVGKATWQQEIIRTAKPQTIAGVSVAVVDEVGVVLLKLYAGGPQDLWDLQQLLAASPDRDALQDRVARRLGDLPPRGRSLWKQVCEG